MAEVLIGAVVEVLVEKLFSGALMIFAKSQGIDAQLEEWKKTLPLFQAVLADAGQKEITAKAVKVWLNDLQELAYDIDDVLDDIATEAMKRDFERSQASTSTTSSKLLIMLPTCCTNFTPRKLIHGQEISSKLDVITSRMKNLYDQKQVLGLVENRKVDTSNRTTTSSVNESKVLGREKDKEALIGQLLPGNEDSDQDVMSVVSIVGMGGLGKTTLAQLLYNDQRVKDHFELRAWVCVSDEFDVFNISMAIYQAVGGENKQFATLDLLHAALKEKLSNKRFLVVLDDVWNEDHNKWNLLRSAFDYDVGEHGSKFLVTTRNKEVASVMDCFQPYELKVLSDEISLSLLAQSAEQNFDDHSSLKLIAHGIIEKCKGLPLALIALGRVLKGKGSDDEWKDLLNSEIWDLKDEGGILPALKLSYYDLPSDLKQVFAYCSLFPKDYVFEKKKLLLLWMAQGFLSQTNGINQPMESLGSDYFDELLSRFFFQPLGNHEYTMHDLMNDLATSVAGQFFFRLDDKVDSNRQDEAYEKFRHFSFISQQRVAEYKKFKELHRARCLRTFLPVSVGWGRFNTLENVIAGLLPQLHFLRVLSLTDYSMTEVPHSIGNLKHLRYLNFSNTDIDQIPEEVGELYNLQSLLVRDCRKLSSLPVSFAKLINLRHLDMADTPSLKKTPLGIGGLTSLQTLCKVFIEGGNGFKVSELKGLKDLQGELSIKGLEKVIDPTQANDANLQEKKGLDDLELVWGNAFGNTTNEDDVIEKLRPHSKLKTLKIKGYGGMKFPSWLGNPAFDQLRELVLYECNNCTDIRTLGHLTSLGKLEIRNCSKLVSIKGEKEAVNVGSSIMGSLRQVTLWNCHSLESYCCPNSVKRLEIYNCSSMTSLSFSKLQQEEENLPSSSSSSSSSNLKYLWIRNCKNIKSIGETEVVNVGSSIMGSLRKVKIEDCHSLESYCCPNGVERLEIEDCNSMTSLSFSKLRELEIRWCSKLVSINNNNKGEKEVVNSIMGSLRHVTIKNCHSLESYCCPNSVEWLVISNCSSMTSLSFSKLQQEEEDLPSSSFSSSSNLKFLRILHCKNMKSIGETEVVNVGSSIIGSLRQVTLWDCEALESYCCPNSVEKLEIWRCSSMTSLSFSKLQDDLPSSSSSSSSNLKFLEVRDCEDIKSISQEHLQSLTSLEDMEVWRCPSMEDSFPSPCGSLWPPNLKSLTIGEIKKPMSEWGLQNYPPSLVHLTLYGENSGVVSFEIMEEQQEDHNHNNNTTCFLLPPSLTYLEIRDFEEVESVSEVLQHLPHLQILDIVRCPMLRDVAKSTSSLTVHVDGK